MIIYVLVYTDDILITGNDPSLIQQTIQVLNSKFSLKTLGKVHYFLGFEAFRNSDGLYLTETKYVHDLLVKTSMLNSKSCSTPTCSSVKLPAFSGAAFARPSVYRSARYQLCCESLSLFLASPTVVHWQACRRILHYLKGTLGLGPLFQLVGPLVLESYADADWASCVDDRRSTSGCCVFLGPNLITWYSRKQKVVSKSSTEAEYRALSQAATEVL
ncbi:hypothetical protein ACOSP7_004250 [Xanthoceras sorbifolium]